MKSNKIVLLVGIISVLGVSIITKPIHAAEWENLNKATVLEAQSLFEKLLNIKSTNITDNIPFDVIFTHLEENCPAESISIAQSQFNSSENRWYEILTNRSSLLKVRVKFNELKRFTTSISSKNINTFCQQKLYSYKVLAYIQNFYNNYSIVIKKGETENNRIENLGRANYQISYTQSTSNNITILHNTDHLNTQERVFAELGELYIESVLSDLITKGILLPADIAHLSGKIHVNYVNQCGTMHGSYHMTQRIGGTDRQLQKLVLNVNLCYEDRYIKNYQKYIDQLLTHELGHYFYYFKDNKVDTFNAICRVDTKNICSDDDFVSAYAQRSKEEDYAETFAYRYMQNKYGTKKTAEDDTASSRVTRLRRKQDHVDNVFGLPDLH